MSILINGATVPETCFECMAIDGLHFIIEELGGHCMMAERIIDPRIFRAREGRLPNCPLVEVPAPHGRLIDGDNVIKLLREQLTGDRDTVYEYYDDGLEMAISELSIVPTIIEAEEEPNERSN